MKPDYDALHDLARRLTDPPSPGGRDGKGRFAKGNPGGPGNPFARRTAELREALCRAVTHEDIQEVARALLVRAQDGDVPAAKLLLSYVVGKPAPAPDPDTLDLHEWALYRQFPVRPHDLHELLRCLPVNFAVAILRPLLQAVGAGCAGRLGDTLARLATPFDGPEDDEDEPEPEPAPPRRQARPRTAAADGPAEVAPTTGEGIRPDEAVTDGAAPACPAPSAGQSAEAPAAVTDANGLNGDTAPAGKGVPSPSPRRGTTGQGPTARPSDRPVPPRQPPWPAPADRQRREGPGHGTPGITTEAHTSGSPRGQDRAGWRPGRDANSTG